MAVRLAMEPPETNWPPEEGGSPNISCAIHCVRLFSIAQTLVPASQLPLNALKAEVIASPSHDIGEAGEGTQEKKRVWSTRNPYENMSCASSKTSLISLGEFGGLAPSMRRDSSSLVGRRMTSLDRLKGVYFPSEFWKRFRNAIIVFNSILKIAR